MEHCPLCGGDRAEVLVDEEAVWARCGCGIVYKRSGSSPSADRLGDSCHERYYERYRRRHAHRVRKARMQILDALEVAERGPLLDVGCSLGYTLEAAHSLGLPACGVEISEHAIEHCRRLGLDARRGSLEALPFEDGAFAVVMLKHVFEHTPRPRQALAELRRVLSAGGTAFFAVPHLGYYKAARPRTSRFFRGEAGRAHFVYYSPETLSLLLEQEGFRVEHVHARLFHRRASLARRGAEAAMLPARLAVEWLRTAARLRKEFWLVASRSSQSVRQTLSATGVSVTPSSENPRRRDGVNARADA